LIFESSKYQVNCDNRVVKDESASVPCIVDEHGGNKHKMGDIVDNSTMERGQNEQVKIFDDTVHIIDEVSTD
jgi:hypothetical protein